MKSTTDKLITTKKGKIPATVVKVIDEFKIVINRGESDGIKIGQRMLVYGVDNEEIKNPNTGESLGYLEIVKGTGKIIDIQDRISILESDKKQVNRKNTHRDKTAFISSILSLEKVMKYDEPIPFENPEIGDLVKPI